MIRVTKTGRRQRPSVTQLYFKGLDVMLKLTRRAGETLVIGDDVKIHILRIKDTDDEIKIGVEAPKDISVHREEIYKRIQAQKAESN